MNAILDERLTALQALYEAAVRAADEHRREVVAERQARDAGATPDEIEHVRSRAQT